ncbi:hypothetical protein O5O45_00330 [Hahella aquimaris]|uniref:HNH endonuclease n=1 Tax=Hahella sp. HNIBRBA332 TaxID=3015983 RepID=UPI00273A9E5F|nr:hypothetical protein [Hahella sp. HNIBRBA332]WLQ14380.1 hypothetical protein O5O45_00330 [Hahella sp. HNIBRBA332]
MSKKYKGKICAYCCENESTKTGDHIFAREFFLNGERNNLPKVPACERCNNEKSNLEHYLTAVLPFGGSHGDAEENLRTLLPPRLEKNQRLRNEILNGSVFGASEETLEAIPLDGQAFVDFFTKASKGLSLYHWGDYIDPETFAYSTCLTSTGVELIEERIFSLNAGKLIENEIGARTISYRGVQAVDNSQISFWLFTIYGGLKVADAGTLSNTICTITAPNKIKDAILGVFNEASA